MNCIVYLTLFFNCLKLINYEYKQNDCFDIHVINLRYINDAKKYITGSMC